MRISKYRPSGKEYLHVNDDKIVKIDKGYVERLKALAKENESGKCMMCLHNDIREYVQEMINVYPARAYVRPHSHPSKTETKTITEGKMLVLLYDSDGEINQHFIMERENIFTLRLDRGIIHTNIPLTDVVFHEVITGPFAGENDSVFPEWAPEYTDVESVNMYMRKLERIFDICLLDRRIR